MHAEWATKVAGKNTRATPPVPLDPKTTGSWAWGHLLVFPLAQSNHLVQTQEWKSEEGAGNLGLEYMRWIGVVK